MKILLKNGRIIDPVTGIDKVSDILIVDGIIQEIGAVSSGKGMEVHDLNGKIIAPGFIDMHVHLREPGFEYKETIETGCRSALAGGFTAVCCMPNTDPPIDDAAIVRQIIERSKNVGDGVVDVYPVGAATKKREGQQLSPMMELAEAGAVAFSDDGAPIARADVMRRALEYAGMIGKPVIQHAEDTCLTRGGAMHEGFVSTSLGMPPMPAAAEDIMIARDIELVEAYRSPYHVAHLSTRGAVQLVRTAKNKGLPVTCEATPHHFTLTDESVRSFDTNTKMNPPLRELADVEAVKEGLRDGTIDVIASDHAPHSYDDKEVEYNRAPFGIVGLETAIGLAYTELVLTGLLPVDEMIRKFSTNPRKILRLPTISLTTGEPANITIIDPEKEWIVDIQKFKSKSKNSPFHGRRLRGKAVGVVNHGILAHSN
ncbi:MAG TPA: dihydroorotase [Bacteroidota bacterium]|nr:dihydroorotase [Bacteroidota bacterium]